MARVADADVLAAVEQEVAASEAEERCLPEARRPDGGAVGDLLQVAQNGIPAALGPFHDVAPHLLAERDAVRPVDADAEELLDAVGDEPDESFGSALVLERIVVLASRIPVIPASFQPWKTAAFSTRASRRAASSSGS